jgi:hypothetical protein
MPRTSRTNAEAKYAKAQKRVQEAAQAMNDAEREARRVADNTARLKALRLARDAKEAAEAAARPPKAKAAARAARKPRGNVE